MQLRAFSVLDTKTGAYGLPFFCHHVALAKRMIYEAVSDERSSLAKYPADYVLFGIGAFDDSTGSLQSHAPESFGSAAAIYAAEINSRPSLELTEKGLAHVNVSKEG